MFVNHWVDDHARHTETHGDVKAAELEAFVKTCGGMTQGWIGSFSKLDALLKNTPARCER